jgi:uncharacterized protein (DUF342 family)
LAESVKIEVSEDGLEAIVKQITPQTTVEEVTAALKAGGVTEGISGEAIQNAVSTAQKGNRPVGDVVAAKGTPPKAPVPPRIEPANDGPSFPQLGPIVKLLQLPTASEVLATAPKSTARSVLPGDILGSVVVEEGEPGKTVTGQAIPIEGPGERKSPSDPGIGVSKSGIEFTASSYGYVGIADGQLSVLPPFWVTEDAMVAAYIYLKPTEDSAIPTVEHLETSLKTAGITTGIDQPGLEKLVAALAKGSKLKAVIPVARGEHLVEPEDAEPEFSFPYISQSGLVQGDGSIDLRERNSFPGVAEGETLVQSKAGVAGKPGNTVRGDVIDVRAAVQSELVAGENVKVEGSAPSQKLVSLMEGGASCTVAEVSGEAGKTIQYTVSVRPVAQISGNVDYDTGNLDFKGNVEIKGSVLSAFIVKATGDIRIGETVETGAQVHGEANLVVQLGIVGENTIVKTAGNVTAKFIQDATVSADGDIAVGSYIRSANVSAKGSIRVEGSGGAVGGILGGEVWAGSFIVSKNVGSEHAYTTTISLGIDRESFAEYQKATRLASGAQDLRHTLLKSIGIKELSTDEIKKQIRAQPHRKHEILRYVQKANDLAKTEEEQLKVAKDLGG